MEPLRWTDGYTSKTEHTKLNAAACLLKENTIAGINNLITF